MKMTCKKRNGYRAALIAAGLLGMTATIQPARADDGDRLITAKELAATAPGSASRPVMGDIFKGPNYLVMNAIRVVPGVPERHEQMADLFIVQAGAADVLIGGELTGDKAITPGEHRGGSMTGGHVRHVAVGDLLWIPAGVPHKVTPTPGAPFRYLVVKIATPAEAGQ
jgi:mannose-6-phosphate isomerase-like protein (cupin superfamily)